MTEEKTLNSNDEYEKQIAALKDRIQIIEEKLPKKEKRKNALFRDDVAVIIISIFVFLLIGYFSFIIWLFWGKQDQIIEGITNHALAAIGLPVAAITSLTLVLLLEEVFGQTIKVKAIGFEFEGAAGPIVLWILGFLAITIAIKTVW